MKNIKQKQKQEITDKLKKLALYEELYGDNLTTNIQVGITT